RLDPNSYSNAWDTLWAVFRPADVSELSGNYSYSGSSFQGVDEMGSDLSVVDLDFGVDFTNSVITGGSLFVLEGDELTSWNASFTGGALNGPFVDMTGVSGTYGASEIPLAPSSKISGAFVNDGMQF